MPTFRIYVATGMKRKSGMDAYTRWPSQIVAKNREDAIDQVRGRLAGTEGAKARFQAVQVPPSTEDWHWIQDHVEPHPKA